MAAAPPPWLDGIAADRIVTLPRTIRRAATVLARGRADRRIRFDFALRRTVDRIGARRVDGADAVHAASLAARRTFAAAPGAEHVLIEDLPDLRRLNDDLDRAAGVHPDARFLRRHRASAADIDRQRAERDAADVLVVRSAFARQCRIEDGVAAERVRLRVERVARHGRRGIDHDHPTLLLAGAASARAGLYEVLDALEQIPEARLVLRDNEGLEPVDALRRSAVRRATTAELEQLDGIDVVVAPYWCEADLPQLVVAAQLGIPVVATTRAAGVVDVDEVEAGDADGLAAAIRRALGN